MATIRPDPARRKRALRPRPPVPVAAAMVSQLTALALLGVDPRRYLDLVIPKCSGHVTALGKLRLVPLDIAVAKLSELAAGDGAPISDEANEVDDQPTTAAGVLAALGRELA